MRKAFIGLIVIAIATSACAKSTISSGTQTSTSTATQSVDPATCAQGTTLLTSGKLTIGADNPAYPPYFVGSPPAGSAWHGGSDPNSGKGFEDAVAYEVASRMGFAKDAVTWTALPYTQSYAPGPKSFDLYLTQVSYKIKRTAAADFSDGYYDVNQALIALKDAPITRATTLTQLKDYVLAAPLGSTSYDYIVDNIQPTKTPGNFNSLSDSEAALSAHQVDGVVVDLPTALYIADPYVQEVHNSVVVGQFTNPSGVTPEHFSFVLPKGSALTQCVDAALASMKADNTLQALTNTWLSQKTNVGNVPTFGP